MQQVSTSKDSNHSCIQLSELKLHQEEDGIELVRIFSTFKTQLRNQTEVETIIPCHLKLISHTMMILYTLHTIIHTHILTYVSTCNLLQHIK